MKTMTCREMGGECDVEIHAESSAEMALMMTEHVKEKHPHVAEKMEKMTNEERAAWETEFHKNWDAAQDVVPEAK